MTDFYKQRNRAVATLRALAVRERRWVGSDDDEDFEGNIDALEWAARKLDGLPEHWVAADGDTHD